MMRVLLTAASALFTLAAPLPALTAAWRAVNGRHPERGVFRPQVLTWSTWAALAIIAGSASRLSAQVFAYACAAGCVAVSLMALRIPAARREPPIRVPLPPWLGRRASSARLDVLMLPGVLAGLACLVWVHQPRLALAVTIGTDLMSYVPTVLDFWRNPWGQPVRTFVLYAAGGVLGLGNAGSHTVVAIAYPAYIVLADGGGVALILIRRLHLGTPPSEAAPVPPGLTAAACPPGRDSEPHAVIPAPVPAAASPHHTQSRRSSGGKDARPGEGAAW